MQSWLGRPPVLGVNVAVKRILLVEDEPTTREILAEVLRGEGYAVDTVAGVSAANLCLRSLPYELIVADWLLPDGDGVAVADAAAALVRRGRPAEVHVCRQERDTSDP